MNLKQRICLEQGGSRLVDKLMFLTNTVCVLKIHSCQSKIKDIMGLREKQEVTSNMLRKHSRCKFTVGGGMAVETA